MIQIIMIHLGAALAFLGLYLYFILQTFLSHKLSFDLHSTKFILYFRLLLILLGVFFAVATPISPGFAFSKYNSTSNDAQNLIILLWSENDGVHFELIKYLDVV